MSASFIDENTPRYQLPFDQLPRGHIVFPQHIANQVSAERARFPAEVYTEDYARRALEDRTLAYYYQDIPVAYRSLPDGLEVLAIGFAEVAAYWEQPVPGVQVVQP
jgi:hypothetical protein